MLRLSTGCIIRQMAWKFVTIAQNRGQRFIFDSGSRALLALTAPFANDSWSPVTPFVASPEFTIR
jgi:hypothetical protein